MPQSQPLPVARHFTGPAPLVWVVGCHGGAGETTLARLIPGARPGGRAWPVHDFTGHPPADAAPWVLLVARTHLAGLTAAQQAVAAWAARDTPPVFLVGLVLSADAPGKLPRPLAQLAAVIGGGVPAVWQLPWQETWRFDPQPPPRPRALSPLLGHLQALSTAPTPTQGAHP